MDIRQQAVLSFVKFNKFFKQLVNDIGITGNVQLTPYVDELLSFEQWKDDVLEYVRVNPDPIILDKITTLGSPVILENYILEGKDVLPPNTSDALKKVVSAVNEMNGLVHSCHQEAKGKYADLVEEFANEEAAALFDRAVKADYLTMDYQPKGDTDIFTLKILAFAIGVMLHLTTRHRWTHFEEQWSIDVSNKLTSVPIGEKQFKRAEKLMKLYPEVDFSALMKPKEDVFFDAVYGSKRVRTLYNELRNHGYISEETTVDQFLGIFNLSRSKTRKPVEWKSNQRKLSYFVYYALSPTNKDFWIKAQSCFTINGKAPHKGSMITGLVSLRSRSDYERYDLVLKRIASEYNNG